MADVADVAGVAGVADVAGVAGVAGVADVAEESDPLVTRMSIKGSTTGRKPKANIALAQYGGWSRCSDSTSTSSTT